MSDEWTPGLYRHGMIEDGLEGHPFEVVGGHLRMTPKAIEAARVIRRRLLKKADEERAGQSDPKWSYADEVKDANLFWRKIAEIAREKWEEDKPVLGRDDEDLSQQVACFIEHLEMHKRPLPLPMGSEVGLYLAQLARPGDFPAMLGWTSEDYARFF